jgi:hypothetical protein
MTAKIFYRERVKVGEGDKQPRFKLVAIAGIDMQLYAKHLRKSELKQIAEAIGAGLVLLKGGDKKKKTDEDVSV